MLSQFIHQNIDSRNRCHVNKPLAWSAYLLSKTFWEVVGVKFYSTVRSNFFYWQFKKTDGLLVYDVKLSLNAQRFDDAIQIKYVRDIINAAPLYSFYQSLLTISWLFPEFVKWDVLQQCDIVLKHLNFEGMAWNDNTRHVWLTENQFQLQCKLKVYPYLSQTSNSRIPSNLATKILEYRLAWCSTRE